MGCSGNYMCDTTGKVYQHFKPAEGEGSSRTQPENHYSSDQYFPFGELRSNSEHLLNQSKCEQTFYEARADHHRTPYMFNGKELDKELRSNRRTHIKITFNVRQTGLYYYGARYYDPRISMWYGVDPMMDKHPEISAYTFTANNPIRLIDPDGRDWYDIDGTITWKDHEGVYKNGDNTYQSLGKNVIVATHNRNGDGVTEDINSATFSLYLESNKKGATATISGNTVPDDPEKSGTLAEGLYSAKAQSRAKYAARGIEDLAIIINGGGELPTVKGNPSKKNSDMLTGVFLHMGNNYSASLHDSKGNAYSHGCQTGGNYKGSHAVYNDWRSKSLNFKGNFYLRARPTEKVSTARAVNNTLTNPDFFMRAKNQLIKGMMKLSNPILF